MCALKISKIDLIPNYGSPERSLLLEILPSRAEYQSLVKSGLPFFTAERLRTIEEKYPDGMTIEEIFDVLTSNGVEFTKPTFRMHVQKKILPEPLAYKNIEGSRVSIYPKDTIAHINLNRYLLKAKHISDMHSFINDAFDDYAGLNVRMAIATKDDYSWNHRGIISTFSVDLVTNGEDWRDMNGYREMFRDVLKYDVKLMKKAISYVDEIEKIYEPVKQKIEEFSDFLENSPISAQSLKKLLREASAKEIAEEA